MVRINLAPGERRSSRRSLGRPSLPTARLHAIPHSPAMLTGAGGLIVLLACVFLYFSERRGLESALAATVEAQADSIHLHTTITRVRALESTQERLKARVELLDDVVEGRLYWLELMGTISQTLPDHTWLQRVDQTDLASDQLRIAGATFANAAVTDYMRELEASALLEDITLVGVTRVESDSFSVQGFTLLGSYENHNAIVVVPADSASGDAGGGE